MPYTPILATLGYVFSPDHEHVLMIHRNARTHDDHFGKYNGLGGKLEPGEDIVAGFRREVREEARIECLELDLAGTISWPGFGKDGEDWFGFIFRVWAFSGVPLTCNHEGELAWIPVDQVESLPIWPGDKLFLPQVLTRSGSQFHGVMPYQNGNPIGWTYSVLGS